MPRALLPVLTPEKAAEIVAEFEALVDLAWTEVGRRHDVARSRRALGRAEHQPERRV